MSSGRLVRKIVRALDRILPADRDAAHLRTGRAGEEAAYFYLRERGYVIVARNWRSPRCHGELDLVGWDGDVLCFIEVKTRSSRGIAPAEAAVDRDKQQELGEVAREYLRRMPRNPLHETSRATPPRRARLWRDGVEERGSPTLATDPTEGSAPSLADSGAATTAAPESPARSGGLEKTHYRFDVLSVYVENSSLPPDVTLFQNAFSLLK